MTIERLLDLGWHLFPRSKLNRAACFKGAHDAASNDPAQIAEWARQYPGCGWCVATGQSAIWALDLDVPGEGHTGDGVATMRALVAKHGPLPRRPVVRTGGGGLLMVFAWRGEALRGDSAALGVGIDPKRGRHSITVPPTLHHRTGLPYRWLLAPWDDAPPVAPDWLLRLLTPKAERAVAYTLPGNQHQVTALLYRACDRIRMAREGSRNDAVCRAAWPVARAVAAGLLSEQEAEAYLVREGVQIGLPSREVTATVRSSIRAARRA